MSHLRRDDVLLALPALAVEPGDALDRRVVRLRGAGGEDHLKVRKERHCFSPRW